MLNAAVILDTNAVTRADVVAIHGENESLTFSELADAAHRLSESLLELGAGAGDRVAIVCPNNPHFIVVYFAVPLNTGLKHSQFRKCLEDCSPALLICCGTPDESPFVKEVRLACPAEERAPILCELPLETFPPHIPTSLYGNKRTQTRASCRAILDAMHATSPDDTACIIYTSGTTGDPKGVELSHANLLALAFAFGERMSFSAKDRILAGMPLFSSFGQTATLCAAYLVGASLVIMPRFNPEHALQLIRRHHVTFFGGVPR